MKYLIVVIILFAVAGVALAESVTTSDGIKFTVTNDVGDSVIMTNSEIMQKVNQTSRAISLDEQKKLADDEVAYSWAGVEQLAVNAVANIQ